MLGSIPISVTKNTTMEKERIATDQIIHEVRFKIVLFIFLSILQDHRKEIADLKSTVISLHAQQHQINTKLTEAFLESVETITAEIDANQERDSLQTKAIELLTKLSKK